MYKSLYCHLLLALALWPSGGIDAQSTGPQPNRRAASVQWNNKWYVQGGYSSTFLNSFHALDLSTSWSTASPPWTELPSGTTGSHFGLVATSDGRIWSVGGNPKPSLLSYYTPGAGAGANGQWKELPDTVPAYPRGLEGHAALVVPNDDKIYIVGGFSNTTGVPSAGSASFTPNLITVFDTAKNAFVPPGPTPAQRGTTAWNDMGWAWLSKKRVALFFGGTRALPGEKDVPLGDLQEFVPWLNEWKTLQTTSGPSPRLDHCMASNADGSKVVVFGGTDGTNYLSDIFILDTETYTWTQGPPASQPRTRMVCTIHNNQLIVWGGSHGSKAPETLTSATPIIYSLATNNWVTTFTPSADSQDPGTDNDPNKGAPKPPPYDPNGSKSSAPLGAIIGGAVAGVVVLALIGFIFYRRSRRNKGGVPNKKTKKNDHSDDSYHLHHHRPNSNGYFEPSVDTSTIPLQHDDADFDPANPSRPTPGQYQQQRYARQPYGGASPPQGQDPNRVMYQHYYDAAGLAAAASAAAKDPMADNASVNNYGPNSVLRATRPNVNPMWASSPDKIPTPADNGGNAVGVIKVPVDTPGPWSPASTSTGSGSGSKRTSLAPQYIPPVPERTPVAISGGSPQDYKAAAAAAAAAATASPMQSKAFEPSVNTTSAMRSSWKHPQSWDETEISAPNKSGDQHGMGVHTPPQPRGRTKNSPQFIPDELQVTYIPPPPS
ncbi:hypothetical protein BGW42_005010 [Actinomortierella wolfii]|nr:hypothetical protein BGW42_005010 [Actinomortierella wolfii]